MQNITFQHWDSRKRATFVNSLSGYRMAYMLGTGDSLETANLAVFNSISHVGSNPPLLGLIFRPLTVERHTYDLIHKHGQLTVNSVPLDRIRAAHATSAKYPSGVSEFEAASLTPVFREAFRAPAVEESPLRMGCSYSGEYLLSENNCIFMVIRIDWVELPTDCVREDGFIDHPKLGNAGVMGLDSYYRGVLSERLGYARPGEPIEPLSNGS